MFYFPIDFILSVQRVGCTKVVCQMNADWSSQNNGQSSLVLEYKNEEDADYSYNNLLECKS